MLPQDPVILLSFVNTKLRDEYASLSALCDDLQADQAAVADALHAIGYEYDPKLNKFI
jgi:hypothetical protein